MFKRKSSDKENKRKLEHKLYLARVNPEPVFDLSDCNLNDIPQGVFALCKVLRKEVLLLDHNKLQSFSKGGNLSDLNLLKVLNISVNIFKHIPKEISCLSDLRELNLSHNELQALPDEFLLLKNLEILDLSYNSLKCLPEEIGKLGKLRVLNISNNPLLNTLPKSLCKCVYLNQVVLDIEKFSWPPKSILENGTDTIKAFLRQELGEDCIDLGSCSQPDDYSKISNEEPSVTGSYGEKLWDLFQQNKLQKQLEQLKAEQEHLKRQEALLQMTLKSNKQQLLQNIVVEQNILEDKVKELQKTKDYERTTFLEQLRKDEADCAQTVRRLLEMNAKPLEQLIKQEKEQEEQLYKILNDGSEKLRKNEILKLMKEMLESEISAFERFHQSKIETFQSVISKEAQDNAFLNNALFTEDERRSELLKLVQQDASLQQAAVATLLEKSDSRCWGLALQVKLVEEELSKLSAIEVDKKRLHANEQLNYLAEERINLSYMLMDLIQQRQSRQSQLLQSLKNVDPALSFGQDYWLLQYQKLVNQMPECFKDAQKFTSTEFAHYLLKCGVLHYLPLLAPYIQEKGSLEGLDLESMSNLGIKNEKDCDKILEAVNSYTNKENEHSNATAPTVDDSSPSTPLTTECVICMEQECQLVLIPCGHVCCCVICGDKIDDCPLCRNEIERKIKMF